MNLRAIIASLALAVLVGCSSGQSNDGPLALLLGELRGIGSGAGDASAPADPRAGLTPELVAQSGLDLLYAEIPVRQGRALLSVAGRNRDTVTWLSTDRISLTFERGQLIATRGFGEDLMAASIGPPLTNLTDFNRTHVYLDGESQTQKVEYFCQRSNAGRDEVTILGRAFEYEELRETCLSDTNSYENIYLVGNTGKILQSKQWISPEIGYLQAEFLSN